MEAHTPAEHGSTDPLTGFRDRTRLLSDLREPAVHPVAVVLLHLDGLEDYRDYFGRLQGDTVLVELADRLDRAVGSAGTCYRARSDEFAVVLPAAAAAGELIARARASLDEPGRYVSIAAVAGTAHVPEEASDPVEALALADRRVSAANPRRRPRERRCRPRADDPRA